jgi:hypothetical protein
LGYLAVGLGIDVVENAVLQFWLNRQIKKQTRGYFSFCITLQTSERRPVNRNLLADADEPKTSGISVDMTQWLSFPQPIFPKLSKCSHFQLTALSRFLVISTVAFQGNLNKTLVSEAENSGKITGDGYTMWPLERVCEEVTAQGSKDRPGSIQRFSTVFLPKPCCRTPTH